MDYLIEICAYSQVGGYFIWSLQTTMKYENRIVLFLDILNFKNLVDATVDKDDKDIGEKIKELHDAVSDLRQSVMTPISLSNKYSRRVTQFSDSLVISIKEDDTEEQWLFFDDILQLIVNLSLKGIFCRGAISQGKLFHDNKVVFGPALIDAYLTESKAALYPRVIFDRVIVEKINKEIDVDKTLQYKTDTDDKVYLDYFAGPRHLMRGENEFIKIHLLNLRRQIIDGLRFKSPDIRIKYGWMKNKYNRAIDDIKSMVPLYGIFDKENLKLSKKI